MPRAITLLHLSDIHFKSREGNVQFDLDAQLRHPLLEDIKTRPANGAAYDGLLVTGDVAFGGKKAEYDRAKEWLGQLFSEANIAPERTYVVPGNHDVNRDMVVPTGAIWQSHAALRGQQDKVLRREMLQTQLSKDPACDPLAPLEFFNEFAQGYGCRTERNKLAWIEIFPVPLNDGSRLRLNGLNSALVSDAGDDVNKLYVSPFQTQHFVRDPAFVELVMCHHPPHWLMDKADIEAIINGYVRVGLFGHEHSHRCQVWNKTVQLFAGAVHPAARDPDWLPTYHILQLSVVGTGTVRKLVVQIFSRELRASSHKFVPRTAEDGNIFEIHEVPLPEWNGLIEVGDQPSRVVNSSETMSAMTEETVPGAEAHRELLVNFHRLTTPLRYAISLELGLLRDGDDFPPQQQWDLVFKRAMEEERLKDLWAAVARKDPAFAKRKNPFDSH